LESWPGRLQSVGGEAVLPAGSRLADEARAGRNCFLLLDGSACAEVAGERIASFSAGSFIGSMDPAGRPLPLAGITVRLITPARVLVLDANRLAALIDSDASLAQAWLRHKACVRKRRA
jgi:hypothetical protein